MDKIKVGRRLTTAMCIAQLAGLTLLATACGGNDTSSFDAGAAGASVDVAGGAGMSGAGAGAGSVSTNLSGSSQAAGASGWNGESAADGKVDFAALQQVNPEIKAWIYVPGTDIDGPICQNADDSFYQNHGADQKESETGSAYISLANLPDLSDFNTVIHGGNPGAQSLFTGLEQFLDPSFFEEHQLAYVFTDGNVLTYMIYAAYQREAEDLLKAYDFTYDQGCLDFLKDVSDEAPGSGVLRDSWSGLTDLDAYNYLITLTTKDRADADQQLLVVGALVQDAAGKLSRDVEGEDYQMVDPEELKEEAESGSSTGK